MAGRTLLVVDVGLRELCAVEATAQGAGLSSVRVVRAAIDPTEAESDAAAIGRQVRAALDGAGIRARSAVFTIARERVMVKRIELPAAEPHELVGMVRLALQHDSNLAADAAVDFVPAGQAAASGRALWVVAASADEMTRVRAIAAAARLGVDRVAPRAFGAAALLSTLPELQASPEQSGAGSAAVAFDLSIDGTELVAADRAGLRGTRGTTMAGDDEQAAVTEARRSWTALRLTQPDLQPVRALALAQPSTGAALAAAMENEVPVTPLAGHPCVAGAGDLGSAWPLAGLLLEEVLRSPRIDLASPRKAPDVAARRRLRIYAAVAVVALAYCIGWTVGAGERRGIESRRTELASKANGARAEYQRALRDELKARHLEAWAATQPAWLDAMLRLHGFAPDPSRTVLESWSGQAEGNEVEATREGAMRLDPAVRMSLDIETTDRASADALREALIARGGWTVRSTSSEGKSGRRLPVALQLLLLSEQGAPAIEKEAAP